jgi:hypothetical protein
MRWLRDALRRWVVPEIGEIRSTQERLLADERKRAIREHLRTAPNDALSERRTLR